MRHILGVQGNAELRRRAAYTLGNLGDSAAVAVPRAVAAAAATAVVVARVTVVAVAAAIKATTLPT